ncbi:MAG: hypothetical protein NC124_16000 [Clostridium sp.]|nr:hypothetical protein [Clostridium sp.]
MKKGLLATVSLLAGTAVGATAMGKVKNSAVEEKTEKIDKFKGYYNMLNQWLVLKQEGKSLEQYFVDNQYKTVAIYGMGEMGNRLYDELKGSNKVKIKYAVDKNANSTYAELEVLESVDDLPEVDIIIVTAIFAFDEIEEELSQKSSCPVVSLDDVVYES